MGCSNTTNKKDKKISKRKNDANGGNAIDVNEGKTGTTEKNRDSAIIINSKEGSSIINSQKKQKIGENDSEAIEIGSIPKNCTHISLPASTTEKMFPVWIERGQRVKLYVRGKWSLFPEYGLVNYKGHHNFKYKHRDVLIGALIGRIQGGDYFAVTDGMVINSQVSGPIYFSANNSVYSVQASGMLDLYFENAKILPENEIEKLLNWNINELNTAAGENYLSEDEKMQYVFLNKMRLNPKQFAQQYLTHLKDVGESYKEIYEKLIHYPSSKLFKPSKALYLAAKDHALDVGENGTTGHKSTDGSDLRMRITKYAIKPSYFGENCSFNLKDPLSVVIQLLVDDGNQTRANRANILNEVFDQVGISVQPHTSYKFSCVQVFGSNIKDQINLN